MLCTKKYFVCFCSDIQSNICTKHVLNLYFSCNSMNNLSSYCGLTDARMWVSEKDLPATQIWLVNSTSSDVGETFLGISRYDKHTVRSKSESSKRKSSHKKHKKRDHKKKKSKKRRDHSSTSSSQSRYTYLSKLVYICPNCQNLFEKSRECVSITLLF